MSTRVERDFRIGNRIEITGSGIGEIIGLSKSKFGNDVYDVEIKIKTHYGSLTNKIMGVHQSNFDQYHSKLEIEYVKKLKEII